MDADSMQKIGSHAAALAAFREGEVQILVGTQMIAKGLDFPRVMVVGVVNADTALHLPDFRAAERTMQLVMQVAGRTGRGDERGRVLIQTFSPEHPAIQAALRHDYLGFATKELDLRKSLGYPPVASMIRLVVRGADKAGVLAQSQALGENLASSLDAAARILGPAPAPLARLRSDYRYHILLQGPDRTVLRDAVRQALAACPAAESIRATADVDPLDML
jgi:primosomal protein N' (replication factor Y)